MLIISCPWCGPRDETEFSYGGEAHLVCPEPTATASDAQWTDYLFMRTNTKGVHRERWQHSGGCRQWFNVQRDTLTNRIIGVYEPGEVPPQGTP